MVDRGARRDDITVVTIPCSEIAEEIGSIKMANMVAVGALLSGLQELTLADVEAALHAHMPGRHKQVAAQEHRGHPQGLRIRPGAYDRRKGISEQGRSNEEARWIRTPGLFDFGLWRA
ncbi:MAG: 2-oxoacid:acceptor oxidoreductase family protein [Candidatus Bathyarchaeia archaeon]|jgi:hypothetical protein